MLSNLSCPAMMGFVLRLLSSTALADGALSKSLGEFCINDCQSTGLIVLACLASWAQVHLMLLQHIIKCSQAKLASNEGLKPRGPACTWLLFEVNSRSKCR